MMLPSRNADPYSADVRPRAVGGASRTIRPIDETVNVTEPMPPRPRHSSRSQ